MPDSSPLRAFIGADSRNTAADYGAVDVTGAVSSATAINANLADRSNNRLALPAGSLLVGTALIDDNSAETEFPPRSAKSTAGAGADQTYITSTVNGWFLTRTGGGWLDGGAQDQSTISGFVLDGQSQVPVFNRNGLTLERTLTSKLADLHLINLLQPLHVMDAVGMTLDRVNVACCLNPNVFEPGPDYNNSGNPGSPPKKLVWIDSHSTANLNGTDRYALCGNILYLGGSREGMGSIALSGQTQAVDADQIRMTKSGFNAVTSSLFGTHFETNLGRSDVYYRHGAHPFVYNHFGDDHIQNGSLFVTHHVWLDLTDVMPNGPVAVVNLFGVGAHSVNGYTPSASRKFFHVVNPNGCVEGRDWFVNNYGSLFTNVAERPEFTNERYFPTTVAITSTAGSLGSVSVDPSCGARLMGNTVIGELKFTIVSNGTGSGALLANGLGYLAKRTQVFIGLDSADNLIRAKIFAGDDAMQIQLLDNAYPGATGRTITIGYEYERA